MIGFSGPSEPLLRLLSDRMAWIRPRLRSLKRLSLVGSSRRIMSGELWLFVTRRNNMFKGHNYNNQCLETYNWSHIINIHIVNGITNIVLINLI